MNEEQIADIAEALYHPEYIADDLSVIFDGQNVYYDVLIDIVVEHLKLLVVAAYNDVEFEMDHDMIENCGVEFPGNTLDEFKKYIAMFELTVSDELYEMLEKPV